jgi:hypothetical protein
MGRWATGGMGRGCASPIRSAAGSNPRATRPPRRFTSGFSTHCVCVSRPSVGRDGDEVEREMLVGVRCAHRMHRGADAAHNWEWLYAALQWCEMAIQRGAVQAKMRALGRDEGEKNDGHGLLAHLSTSSPFTVHRCSSDAESASRRAHQHSFSLGLQSGWGERGGEGVVTVDDRIAGPRALIPVPSTS